MKYGKQVLDFDGISVATQCRNLLSHLELRLGTKISGDAQLIYNGRFLNMNETMEEVRCDCTRLLASSFANQFLENFVVLFCFHRTHDQAGLIGHPVLEVIFMIPGGAIKTHVARISDACEGAGLEWADSPFAIDPCMPVSCWI